MTSLRIVYLQRFALAFLTLHFFVNATPSAFAQDNVALVDSSKRKIDFVFSVGGGIVRFMGDVQDASKKVNVNLLGNRPAADLNLGLSLSKSFTLNLNAIYGKLSGNENTFKEHRNFDAQMVLAGFNVEYNFAGLYKKRVPVLNPFLLAGAYYSNYFNINTDLLYNGNNSYHYWSDGRIRDLAEDSPDFRDANNVSRDYDYETSLVKNPINAFTASGGLGIDLHLSRAFTVRLMSRYFYAISDNLDGYESGLGDGFFLNQISLVVNTMAFIRSRRGEEPAYKYLFDPTQLVIIENEDLDEDGVKDILDRCAATPKGVEVDKDGCPLDNDADGIADYRDSDKQTPLGDIVDVTGAAINYELIAFYATDTLGVKRIKWDKKYLNPRYNATEGPFTVNVKTLKTGSEQQLSPNVREIKELRKEVINDSLIIYRLGTYEHFADADLKSKELAEKGEGQSYGVPESTSLQVAYDLYGMQIPDSILKVRTYGIGLSLPKIKSSKAYSDMSLSYSVGRIENHLQQGVPESILVKDYLNAIRSFTWDETIQQIHAEVSQKLEEQPVVVSPAYFDEPTEVLAANQQNEALENNESSSLSNQVLGTDTMRINSKSNVNSDNSLTAVPKKINKINIAPVRPEFKAADIDANGFISSKEIERVLEEILEGNSPITVAQFNEMVKYYSYFTDNADPIDFGGTQVVIVDGVLSILKMKGDGLKEESRRILAKKYHEADINKDGDLTAKEVQSMINKFTEGDKTYSSDKIYELIDLYFD
ncbi:MAG: hypothetical protein K9G41_01945 [Flavobacteriales bacterium]|nr:hypothetical protein [Flavobacteriales bacterium]